MRLYKIMYETARVGRGMAQFLIVKFNFIG